MAKIVYIYLFLKQYHESCVRDFSILFLDFVRYKFQNGRTIDHVSKIEVPDCSKLIINQKNNDEVIICRDNAIVKLFGCCRFSLFKYSYWSQPNANIIIGSEVNDTFFKKTPLSFVQYLQTGVS